MSELICCKSFAVNMKTNILSIDTRKFHVSHCDFHPMSFIMEQAAQQVCMQPVKGGSNLSKTLTTLAILIQIICCRRCTYHPL